MSGLEFRDQGSGTRVRGSGCRGWGLGFRVDASGFTIYGSVERIRGQGFRVGVEGWASESGLRVLGFLFTVQVIGFRAKGSGSGLRVGVYPWPGPFIARSVVGVYRT